VPGLTFAEFTNNAKTMVAGLRANEATVAGRGLSLPFIDQMEKTLNSINSVDNEQEALKAKLKTKTSELGDYMSEMRSYLKEAKQTVKLAVPQEGWREFGIEAKR
jgi:hypothetical protein